MAASTLLTPGSILRFSGGFIAASVAASRPNPSSPNFSAIVAKGPPIRFDRFAQPRLQVAEQLQMIA